jgi:hypothetical protein
MRAYALSLLNFIREQPDADRASPQEAGKKFISILNRTLP